MECTACGSENVKQAGDRFAGHVIEKDEVFARRIATFYCDDCGNGFRVHGKVPAELPPDGEGFNRDEAGNRIVPKVEAETDPE